MRRWCAVAHGATVDGEPVEVEGIPVDRDAWQVFWNDMLIGVVERRRHLGGLGHPKTRWRAYSLVGMSEHPTRTQALGRMVADTRPRAERLGPYAGLDTLGPDVRGKDWEYWRKKWTQHPAPRLDGP